MDWQPAVVKYLISGGVMGRSQASLIAKAGGHIRDGEVIGFLRILAEDKKAQKYILPGQVPWWRATTNILKLS